jgi:ActR/RegA family two-component response regulator
MNHLLIVEDDEVINRCLCSAMEAEGYRVFCAHDRQGALAFYPTPMLALIDMGLPPAGGGISEGLFLIDALLATEPLSKIVVITGHGEEYAALETVRRGAFDFLRKPASIYDIASAVKRADFFLDQEMRLLQSGEARLHLTLRLADGPKECADALEEKIVRHTLAHAQGNVSKTARRLGIARENLYYYLKKYGIGRV